MLGVNTNFLPAVSLLCQGSKNLHIGLTISRLDFKFRFPLDFPLHLCVHAVLARFQLRSSLFELEIDNVWDHLLHENIQCHNQK